MRFFLIRLTHFFSCANINNVMTAEKPRLFTKLLLKGKKNIITQNHGDAPPLLVEDTNKFLDQNLASVQFVEGDLRIKDSYISTIPHLKEVSGDLVIENTKIKMFYSLETVGGNLVLKNSEIIALDGLKNIGKNLVLQNSKILWVNNLEEIGGSLGLHDSYISRMLGLKKVGGCVKMIASEIDWVDYDLHANTNEEKFER